MNLPPHISRKSEINRVKKHKRRARDLGLSQSLNPTQWFNLLKFYKWGCAFCGSKKDLTLEHLVPLIMGGGTTRENCVPACQTCNMGFHNSRLNGVN